ncbi:ribonuclease H-like protein [Daldinia vernicosa]|uniref:ribonuclease H-like protein n=1 Tax=Daldinia vernicosa TaxID=114800 RepID=UPI0020072E79|nr:ribonuclease H-like protein [Daldinia vernicosa]KAI0846172.1 ribonuclease H-like protein [Daldinia vernicosa]
MMKPHHNSELSRDCAKANIALVAESQQAPRFRKRLTRRTPIRSASRFVPQDPNETPEHHFPLQTISSRFAQSRFINRYDSREILILIDGSCINNGSKNQTAKPSSGGCSFTFKGPGRYGSEVEHPFKDANYNDGGMVGFPLEKCGPRGENYDATSNRAKLRAVIAALEFRDWQEEGWRRIVIATDLKYVVDGAISHLPTWVRRGWRTSKLKKVANRDLWEELNGVIENLQRRGTSISFWLLRSGSLAKTKSTLVRETKGAAREAAIEHTDETALEFTRLCGIML